MPRKGERQKFCKRGHDQDLAGRYENGQCKLCVREQTKAYRLEHPRPKDQSRRYEANNSQRRRDLAIAMNGGSTACAICKIEKSYMVVDHNHTTNEVRGLLCNSCNVAIGLLQEDEELMLRAITYVKER